ncbi:MAG: hypothetical protein RL071_4872, partial [Pseudomonadota bacterium]
MSWTIRTLALFGLLLGPPLGAGRASAAAPEAEAGDLTALVDAAITRAIDRDPAVHAAAAALQAATGAATDAAGLQHNPSVDARLGF